MQARQTQALRQIQYYNKSITFISYSSDVARRGQKGLTAPCTPADNQEGW